MNLWAIGDLHVGFADNRAWVQELPAHPDDWLALVGDVGETTADLRFVLETLGPRFAKLLWVPGNHELWTVSSSEPARGEAKYDALVATCRELGVLTPEDPYETLGDHLVAPIFTLYDYSFCPDGMSPAEARAWAAEAGLVCADEMVLHPDPHPSREAWCAARCATTEARLARAMEAHAGPSVIIGHFPLHPDLALLPRIPRFAIWCGTRRTAGWHRRFRASVVVFGHLHIRQTRVLDGVRFEEVSLGYPRQWKGTNRATLRRIL